MNTPDIERAHRWFAVEYNNRAWNLLERTDRSEEENEFMVHSAHASLLHWKEVGTRINALRAYYLLAYAHAAAGEGSAAIRYGDRSLALMQDDPEGLADWDVAFTYDAVARAHTAAGNPEPARDYRQKAQSAGEQIADEEDRKIFTATFNTLHRP